LIRLQVLLENDVVPVKPPRNCTAEVLEQITEMHSAGTYESTAGGTETQQLAWATAQTTECEAEIAAALAAQKAEDDMDALFSGSLSDTVKRERSDDPYTACIMEQPCLDTWTQITEYTVTVITLGLILLLCFIEITSMFVYGQDAGHMEPREPRLVRTLHCNTIVRCCCALPPHIPQLSRRNVVRRRSRVSRGACGCVPTWTCAACVRYSHSFTQSRKSISILAASATFCTRGHSSPASRTRRSHFQRVFSSRWCVFLLA
jgi:hypothetical protein